MDVTVAGERVGEDVDLETLPDHPAKQPCLGELQVGMELNHQTSDSAYISTPSSATMPYQLTSELGPCLKGSGPQLWPKGTCVVLPGMEMEELKGVKIEKHVKTDE